MGSAVVVTPKEEGEDDGGASQQQKQPHPTQTEPTHPTQTQKPRRRRGKRAPAPRVNASAEISRLAVILAERREQVDVLWKQRHVLRARATAAQHAVAQCLALLNLGTLLQQQQERQQEEQQQERREQQGDAVRGHPWPPLVRQPGWHAHLDEMRRQLEEDGASATASAAATAPPGLGWSLEASAACAAAGARLDLSGMRAALRTFTQRAGHLYL